MKRKFGGLFLIILVVGLVFSVSNFIPPAQTADWVIYGTTTYVPGGMGPQNEWLRLYGDYYCIYNPSNCTIIQD